jgi:hypothetical protein
MCVVVAAGACVDARARPHRAVCGTERPHRLHPPSKVSVFSKCIIPDRGPSKKQRAGTWLIVEGGHGRHDNTLQDHPAA